MLPRNPHNSIGGDVKPLGGAPSPATIQENYLILLKEPENKQENKQPFGRAEIVRANEKRTSRFSRLLEKWIQEEHLDEEVSAIGEPMAFPMLAITCTPAVAQRIASMPDVDDIVPDSEEMQFIR